MADQSKPPHQLRNEALSTLQQAITKLKSSECMVEVRKAPVEVQDQWAKTLLKLDEARDDLEKAELAQIRDQLKENENELAEGARSLNKALETLETIKQVLNIATTFINIVSKVVAFRMIHITGFI